MSIESMKRISACEEEAVSIRKQAQADAKQMLEQGKKQASDILETSGKQADEQYRQTMAQAEAEASEIYSKRMAEVTAECESMKQQAAAKLPEAVKIITGKVVNSSVYCKDEQAFHYWPGIR